MFRKLSEKKWFNGAVIACISVAFYVLLTNIRPILSDVGHFLGHFRSIFLGIVFAYILNPLAMIIQNKLLKRMKAGNLRWYLSVGTAVVSALAAFLLLMGTLIPQLLQSISVFANNYDGYAAALIRALEGSPLRSVIDPESLQNVLQNASDSISGFLKNNTGQILGMAAGAGKSILSAVIALIVAVYFLMGKKRVLKGWWRLVRSVCGGKAYMAILNYVLHCDVVLMRYLGQTLLDALIVGTVNALFMLACGMQYIGLVSIVVAVTNLVPNFGPIIGGAIGGFVLLLVNPMHALVFVIFSLLLQFVDGYILKPRLFSNSLGVSGLLIIAASIVLGNMFGVLGMLLSVPISAILSFTYHDYILPRRERHHAQDAPLK